MSHPNASIDPVAGYAEPSSDLDRTTLQDALRVCFDKAEQHYREARILQEKRIRESANQYTIPDASSAELQHRDIGTRYGVAADCLRDCLEA